MSSYRITVSGDAKAHYTDRMEEWHEEEYPDMLDGVSEDSGDSFSNYFDDTSWSSYIRGGSMDFNWDDKTSKLIVRTQYTSSRKLNDDELKEVLDYTTGQWSDGFGEGFEQYPCYNDRGVEYYVSAWHNQQVSKIEQEEIVD